MATIGERLIKRLGGATQREVSRRISEAYEQGYNDGGEDEPVSGTTRKFGYRRIGGGGRDFEIDRETALNAAWSLWQSNPLGDRPLEIKRDYILGRGFSYQTDDEELTKILDAFWADNRLRRRMKEYALQLFLFGVQCFPVFVRESDGRVRLGYFDPAEIEDVIQHPDNALEMWAVVIKEQVAGSGLKAWHKERGKRVYRIVRKAERGKYAGRWVTAEQAAAEEGSGLEEWEAEMLEVYGLEIYSGSCIYERVNCVSNQPWGYSDLLSIADWVDQLDEVLFALADREHMANYLSWDVTVEGASPDEVEERAKKILARPPKKGSVNVHNEKETWQLNYPDLKQMGSIETANALQTFVLGGLGLPRHWFGHGDETNRATAQAQGDPTWRSLETAQDIVRDLIVLFLELARDQAAIAGNVLLEGEEAPEIDVVMPEMTSKDLTAVASAASALASALMVAEQQGWISKDKAAEAWSRMMAELGVEVDPEEELAAADADREDAELAPARSASDFLMAHGVLTEPELAAAD